MIGYSPVYPLQISDQFGAYAINTTLKGVIKQNFVNLLLTTPGERIMDINFGIGLRNFLFEPNTTNLHSKILAKIQQQKETYMPFIDLRSVDFNSSHLSQGSQDQILEISIVFSAPTFPDIQTFVIGAPENL